MGVPHRLFQVLTATYLLKLAHMSSVRPRVAELHGHTFADRRQFYLRRFAALGETRKQHDEKWKLEIR